MRLVHYSDQIITNIAIGDGNDYSEYYKSRKPVGFWVSDDDDEHNWKWWCEREEFSLDKLKNAYDIKLVEKHNILILQSAEEIYLFSQNYGAFRKGVYWNTVKERYSGIIITPYISRWELPDDLIISWYDGWDCASGCIWDLNAIESIKVR